MALEQRRVMIQFMFRQAVWSTENRRRVGVGAGEQLEARGLMGDSLRAAPVVAKGGVETG